MTKVRMSVARTLEKENIHKDMAKHVNASSCQ